MYLGHDEDRIVERRKLELPVIPILIVIAIVCTVIWAFGGEAKAQPRCMPYAAFAEAAFEGFGEKRIMIAVEKSGGLMEFWGNEETGTWTTVMRVKRPGGVDLACPMAVGEGWSFSTDQPGSRASF